MPCPYTGPDSFPPKPAADTTIRLKQNSPRYLLHINVRANGGGSEYIQNNDGRTVRYDRLSNGRYIGVYAGRPATGNRIFVRIMGYADSRHAEVPERVSVSLLQDRYGSVVGRVFTCSRSQISFADPAKTDPNIPRIEADRARLYGYKHNMTPEAFALKLFQRLWWTMGRSSLMDREERWSNSRAPSRMIRNVSYMNAIIGDYDRTDGGNAYRRAVLFGHKSGGFNSSARASMTKSLKDYLRHWKVLGFSVMLARMLLDKRFALLDRHLAQADKHADGAKRRSARALALRDFNASLTELLSDPSRAVLNNLTKLNDNAVTPKAKKKLARMMRGVSYNTAATMLRNLNSTLLLSHLNPIVEARMHDRGLVKLNCGHWHEMSNPAGVVHVLRGRAFSFDAQTGELVGSAVHRMCARCFESFRHHMYRAVIDSAGHIAWIDGRYQSANRITSYEELGLTQDFVDKVTGQVVEFTTLPQEQPIGNYHSSRQFFTNPLPHINGHKTNGSELKVGFELEFVQHPNNATQLQTLALEMRKRLEPVAAVVKGAKCGSRYAAFEYDGSVDYEMVSGYGPMDIHRAAIHALLDGAPYAGRLRSHDGGRCGLHVHLDKPTSFLHASKLTEFWHSQDNRGLIKAVARRYGNSYAKAVPDKFKTSEWIRNTLSDASYGYTRAAKRKGSVRKEILRNAINRINSGDRYELLNFQPNRTVEVRAFRGSMIPTTVIACLEFAYMSWLFARDCKEMTTVRFVEFVNRVEHRADTKYLRPYLKNKGYDVWVPRPAPTPAPQVNYTDEREAA